MRSQSPRRTETPTKPYSSNKNPKQHEERIKIYCFFYIEKFLSEKIIDVYANEIRSQLDKAKGQFQVQ